MLKKILPIILLLVGSGAGVGAGIFLRPVPEVVEEGDTAHADGGGAGHETGEEGHKDGDSHAGKDEDSHAKKADDDHDEEPSEMEYVKLNNQFVVPVVKDQNVASLVVLSLSVEVPIGNKDSVYQREPKVRDSFLRVLFDHANIGGFDGAFTDAQMLNSLRTALREVAQRDLGSDVVHDVLILEIARQDY